MDIRKLMKKPCMGCQEDGHHVDVCLNNQQPSLDAQDPNGKELLDTRFGNWSDVLNQIASNRSANKQNIEEDLPSLYPH